LLHLLLHTTPLIRMKLAYNAYPESASSYQNNKIAHKKNPPALQLMGLSQTLEE